MRTLRIVLAMAAAAIFLSAQSRTLDIYWIDVEGGASTLIVAPSGESLLVDTGFPGNDDRDPLRERFVSPEYLTQKFPVHGSEQERRERQ